MRKLIAAIFILSSIPSFSQWALYRSVEAWAESDATDGHITLHWVNESYHTGCQVQRRDYLSGNDWGNALANLNAGINSWTDENTEKGKQYEYRLICTTNKLDPNTNNTANVTAVGYLLAGNETITPHRRGNIALVTESSISDSLADELNLLASDLSGDGWTVHRMRFHRDSSHIALKTELMKLHNRLGAGLQAIYLFGHLPVPYSGNFNASTYYPPDAHVPDHNGAWAADVYYGVVNGNWTDNITNEAGINREANKNRPADGKFDQNQIPGKVEIQVGRVDLANMSKFSKSEIELLRQYIQKSHDYRHGLTATYELSLIDDNFKGMAEGFATTAWTSFSAMFGPENIRTTDFLQTLKDSSFLMAYGCGAGSYRSCNGIGTTDDLVVGNGAVFNFLFGSYFGDWDVENSFLRAPLASDKLGLTNAWSGRPLWQMHPMALGRNIGEVCMLSQNNTDQNKDYLGMNFRNTVHIALMGDPTLRLHVVEPPSNLILSPMDNGKQVKLEWTASADPEVIGYHVYRGKKADSTFNLIINQPVINTSYVDATPYDENSYYMVRAVRLQKSASGSYYNLSQGIHAYIDGIEGGSVSTPEIAMPAFNMYPNPAQESLHIFTTKGGELLKLYDMSGKLLMEKGSAENALVHLQIGHLAEGVYLVNYLGQSRKLVIAR